MYEYEESYEERERTIGHGNLRGIRGHRALANAGLSALFSNSPVVRVVEIIRISYAHFFIRIISEFLA